MKKKRISFLCFCLSVCLLAAACLTFVGCSDTNLSKIKVSGKQDTSYIVRSNGGMAVQYGNYVYFVNGTSGYEDTNGKQNTWPNVIKGGLYRAELNGKREGNDFIPAQAAAGTTVEAGLEFVATQGVDSYEQPTDVVNVQRIAPKRIGTTGYNNGGIFIYDDYVYFASPNNEKNKSGNVQTTKTDFFRVKLDGSDAKKIYTTSASGNESNPYAFYKYDGAVYLVAQDGTDVVSVRAGKKIGDKVTIAQDVASVLLPYSETYYKGMNENTLDHFVYVLRTVTDENTQQTGNVIEIMRPDGKSGGLYHKQGKTDTLEAVRDGLLFYRTTDNSNFTRIKYDSLHNFLMGNNEYTDEDGNTGAAGSVYGDAAYKAYQEKLAGYKDETGAFKAGVTDEQKAEYNENARMQLSGEILATSAVSDYTSTYCFRPGGESSNLVYMLGVKANATELRSSLSDTVVVHKSSSDDSSVSALTTILNVTDEYVYFKGSTETVYRTLWQKPASEKSAAEMSEQVSETDVTAFGFNGDYCAGYIVYVGKVDEWADAYTFFKQVDRVEGAKEKFVGRKTDADTRPEEDEEEDTANEEA